MHCTLEVRLSIPHDSDHSEGSGGSITVMGALEGYHQVPRGIESRPTMILSIPIGRFSVLERVIAKHGRSTLKIGSELSNGWELLVPFTCSPEAGGDARGMCR